MKAQNSEKEYNVRIQVHKFIIITNALLVFIHPVDSEMKHGATVWLIKVFTNL